MKDGKPLNAFDQILAAFIMVALVLVNLFIYAGMAIGAWWVISHGWMAAWSWWKSF